MGMDVRKEVVALIGVVFLLLGALFGIQITTFIFGNLGPEASGLSSGSTAFNVSSNIQNNSLVAMQTYSAQANTQMNTIAIAITLVILLAVFALFWFFFMGQKGRGSGGIGDARPVVG